MTVISDEARQYIAAFEDVTGAPARDCLVEDDGDRLVFLVAPGEMARAIGPDGETVHRLEEELDAKVRLVEDADDPATFVANALAPAVVHHVTISQNDTTVAYVEVDDQDKGVAIGSNGRNIEAARALAERHFDVADVQLT
jgi:N utilization substance protein A